MLTNDKGLAIIENFEGLRLISYLLAGEKFWSIGYGHSGADVKSDTVWTYQQAVEELRRDVRTTEMVIDLLVKVSLTSNQFSALVPFVYNIGSGNFKMSSVLKYINAGRFAEVPGRMALWNKDSTLKVSPGLVRRRKAEGDLWKS